MLVDSEPHANRVLSELLTECGVPTTYEESLRDYVGSSIPRVRGIAEERLGKPLPGDFERRYYGALFERLRHGLEPIAGVREAIERLGQPVCVASSGSRERIELSLGLTGLIDLFGDRLFSADQVEHGKPAPDLFLLAAESLGAEPSRCVVIEDSPLGIEAANAAGMTSFGFAAHTPRQRLRGASGGVFTSMEQLPELLGA